MVPLVARWKVSSQGTGGTLREFEHPEIQVFEGDSDKVNGN